MRRHADWFFDSVVLSNFAVTASLQVLAARYGRHMFATAQVMDEIAVGIVAGHARLKSIQDLASTNALRMVVIGLDETATYQDLLSRLGGGEASTIAVARTRRGIVVTDDRAARTVCDDMKTPVVGTIGILKACVRDKAMTVEDADTLLHKIVAAGFFSPVARISDIL